MYSSKIRSLIVLFYIVALAACKKEEPIVFTGNTIPEYNAIPTLLVENYVNRLFIDLIGREPTDAEMQQEVAGLEAGNLSMTSRNALVDKLMTSTAPLVGDSTYSHAYAKKIILDHKGRFLDGASDLDLWELYNVYYGISVLDSLAGNTLAYQLNREQANKMRDVINCSYLIRTNQITIDEVCRRMCLNPLYDEINMNSFNFINATFNDLYYRFPTDAEMDQCFPAVDYNASGVLFGQIVSNKVEYMQVMLSNQEFAQGMIRWAYFTLLSREPTPGEMYYLLPTFNIGRNIRAVQKFIVTSDEYAGFD